MKVLRDLYSFLGNPTITVESRRPIEKISLIFQLYISTIILVFIVGLLNALLVLIGVFENPSHVIDRWLDSNPESHYLIITLIVLPLVILLEESSFRLLLTSYKRSYLLISISLCLSTLSFILLDDILWQFDDPIFLLFRPIIYTVSFSIFYYFIVRFVLSIHELIKPRWAASFKYVYYSSAILFTAYHIPSLQLDSRHLLLLPVVLSPYFIYGLILGYVRLKLGFAWSVLLHFLINLPVIYSILRMNF